MQAPGAFLILALLAAGAAPVAGVGLRKPAQAAASNASDALARTNVTQPAKTSNASARAIATSAPASVKAVAKPSSPTKQPRPAKTSNASAHVLATPVAVSVSEAAKRASLIKNTLPAKTSNVSMHAAARHVPAETPVTTEQVQQYRAKLEAVSTKLRGMLDRKHGALGKAKLAPTLKVFARELEQVLRNTTSVQDPAAAMHQLQAVGHSIGSLTKELTSRQEQLMIEDESQRESLLLGVLMSKQKEPMDEQMAVLQNSDFRGLPVSRALLAAHNVSRPLYAQVAEFLDKHRGAASPVAVTAESGAAARAYVLAASLQKRVTSMEKELKIKQRAHEKRARLLKEGVSRAKKEIDRRMARSLQKREARNFHKFEVTRLHDIASMKSAVEAVRRGDAKALERARNALAASLKALQSRNGGFLVLLSMGHKFMDKDCPYCAAQCVDACHQQGKPYVACLQQCADAGKGL